MYRPKLCPVDPPIVPSKVVARGSPPPPSLDESIGGMRTGALGAYIELLLRYGADTTLTDYSGHTPAQMPDARPEVLESLRNAGSNEVVQHGAALGLGIATMATEDEEL